MTAQQEARELISIFYSENEFGIEMELAKQDACIYVNRKIKEYEEKLKHYKKVELHIQKIKTK